MNTESLLTDKKVLFEKYLDEYIGKLDVKSGLIESCIYSLKAPGKRLRPCIAMLCCEACGGRKEDVMPVAMAIEMIHTFSLIHDDLPAIDNDDFRRGRPANHKKFGEATAILAGDALIFMAFSVVGSSMLLPDIKADIMNFMAYACGDDGLVMGEYDDVKGEGVILGLPEIENIYLRKTARLFELCAYAGARTTGAPAGIIEKLTGFGRHLGLAFQAIDDILDVISDSATLGKSSGKDIIQDKATIVKALGLDNARRWAKGHTIKAVEALSGLKRVEALENIATEMLKRIN